MSFSARVALSGTLRFEIRGGGLAREEEQQTYRALQYL